METGKHGEMVTWKHGNMEKWRHGEMEKSNGKWKKEAQAISFIHLSFAHCRS
jgi:hypothetical protein